jgi:hypothetical protein
LRSCSAFSQSAQLYLRCPHHNSTGAEITFFTGDQLGLLVEARDSAHGKEILAALADTAFRARRLPPGV